MVMTCTGITIHGRCKSAVVRTHTPLQWERILFNKPPDIAHRMRVVEFGHEPVVVCVCVGVHECCVWVCIGDSTNEGNILLQAIVCKPE